MTKLIKENEQVLFTVKKIKVIANANRFILDLILTNERLILLQDKAKDLDYVNILSSRGLQFPEDLEVVLDISLNDIKIIYNDNINHVTFKDNNNILELYTENLNQYLS